MKVPAYGSHYPGPQATTSPSIAVHPPSETKRPIGFAAWPDDDTKTSLDGTERRHGRDRAC